MGNNFAPGFYQMNGKAKDSRITLRFGATKLKLPEANILDQILGLRSWGLILYGALPASLSLLGFIDVKVGKFNTLAPVLLISLLPLLLTFLLVRARQKEWYFTSDYLNLRSFITTLLIVVCATLISGASGIIRGEYEFSPSNLTDERHMTAMAGSFLMGVASLVFSSTLFATILTKGADLPGLPSTTFVTLINGIRQQLIAIRINPIWQKYEPEDGLDLFDELKDAADKLQKELDKVLSQPGLKLAKDSLKPVRSDLDVFVKCVTQIKAGQVANIIELRWKIYFADFKSLQSEQLQSLVDERATIAAEYEALQRLKRLRLGG